jgi:hypothetical protein
MSVNPNTIRPPRSQTAVRQIVTRSGITMAEYERMCDPRDGGSGRRAGGKIGLDTSKLLEMLADAKAGLDKRSGRE